MSELPPRPTSRPARAAAFLISAITSPFLVTAVTVTLVVLVLRPTAQQLLVWAGLSVLFGAIIPFCVVFYMWRVGVVTDPHVAVREQRTWPFVAALLSGCAGVLLLHLTKAPPLLVALGVVYLAVGAALAVVSLYWKVSVHSGVTASAIISLTLVGYDQAVWALAVLPLVLWARHYRGRHTLAQGVVPLVIAAIVTPLAYFGALALVR